MSDGRRGGVPALLAGLRLATKTPVARALLRKLAEEIPGYRVNSECGKPVYAPA